MKELSLNELRIKQMSMLKDVDSYCSANGLTYFLTYGTLIGAIRHSGYIPWDDDIDILMPRPDYEKFIRNYKMKDSFVVSNVTDPNYQYLFAKVSDNQTILVEDTSKKTDLGVYIDVFPLDGMPDSIEEGQKQIMKKKKWLNFYNVKRLKLYSTYRAKYKNIVLLFLKICLLPIPFKYVEKKLYQIMTRYSYEHSNNVVEMIFANPTRIVSKELFSKAIKWKFEDTEFNVPIGYDKYLTSIYGDYMKLPKEENRITHHRFKVYWK